MAAELILASTSPYRRALLERLGLPFRCLAPNVDEDALKSEGLAPEALASRLARLKAESVASLAPDAVVLGGDQLVAFEGRILGKPGDADRAVAQLLALAGRPHELITAIALLHPRGRVEHVDRARLWMRPLTREEAERYVAADRPWDCAGSYKLESRGVALFERIEASDHSAITGLPLLALAGALRSLGYAVP
jgi:septum formation protein